MAQHGIPARIRWFVLAPDTHATRSSALSLPIRRNTSFEPRRRSFLPGGQTGHHFLYVVLYVFAFYSANYCEPAQLMTNFNPGNSPAAAKPTRARYQSERRDFQLDLDLHAYRRAFRGEDKHAAEPCISAVANIVVFYAIGPAEEDWQNQWKPAKGSPLDRKIHT
jgi:hypothetical protein